MPSRASRWNVAEANAQAHYPHPLVLGDGTSHSGRLYLGTHRVRRYLSSSLNFDRRAIAGDALVPSILSRGTAMTSGLEASQATSRRSVPQIFLEPASDISLSFSYSPLGQENAVDTPLITPATSTTVVSPSDHYTALSSPKT